eukprot:Nitzschia sp. Nitz4//scaffold118_size93875//5494//7119//NITZ4_004775-RA/size93875-processed-gene-0.52-mRNA-1//-1//CDS//3329533685//485//frame0
MAGNRLKQLLKGRGLSVKGTKPVMALRLTHHDLNIITGSDAQQESPAIWDPSVVSQEEPILLDESTIPRSFAGLALSDATANALAKARFFNPSPIQRVAIPLVTDGNSIIMHAETGSGKTLAYLLPLTERTWRDHEAGIYSSKDGASFSLILTPTRELASQVAGIASVLAPPGSVRFISHPTNLMADNPKERGFGKFGEVVEQKTRRGAKPTLFIGSAKTIMHSIFGGGKLPEAPTPEALAKVFVKNVNCIVLDEVDRLLDAKLHRGKPVPRHDKPAAIITAAVAKRTFGKAQTVAASATVGRVLRRELARVLGLPPKQSPGVVRADDSVSSSAEKVTEASSHEKRAVSIPAKVDHYLVNVGEKVGGQLLTSAAQVLKNLMKTGVHKRVLLVLSKTCDVKMRDCVGALGFMGVQPEPIALHDALDAQGTDFLMQAHRDVSGATGIGQSSDAVEVEEKSYILVTGEDSIRGLHFDNLSAVVTVGQSQGPDEYTHIAGRTGRAGLSGKVISVLTEKQHAALKGWETMLGVKFQSLSIPEIADL